MYKKSLTPKIVYKSNVVNDETSQYKFYNFEFSKHPLKKDLRISPKCLNISSVSKVLSCQNTFGKWKILKFLIFYYRRLMYAFVYVSFFSIVRLNNVYLMIADCHEVSGCILELYFFTFFCPCISYQVTKLQLQYQCYVDKLHIFMLTKVILLYFKNMKARFSYYGFM